MCSLSSFAALARVHVNSIGNQGSRRHRFTSDRLPDSAKVIGHHRQKTLRIVSHQFVDNHLEFKGLFARIFKLTRQIYNEWCPTTEVLADELSVCEYAGLRGDGGKSQLDALILLDRNSRYFRSINGCAVKVWIDLVFDCPRYLNRVKCLSAVQ